MNYLRLIACAMILANMASIPGAAQQTDSGTAALASDAGAAFDAQDWAKAAKLYEELSQSPDAPPRVWLRLGAALRQLGSYQSALAAFEKANAAGAGLFAEYGEAAVYAAMKDTEKSFEHLTKSLQQGYAQPDVLSTDPDFAALRADPRFAKLVEQARKNQRPCAYTPENRQFDFWVGEWSVATTQGAVPAGDSRIELILEDCIVQENWKSLNSPYSGKSYNVYNQSLKRWEQYWVDDVGGNIFFYGGLRDGVMDYFTDEIPQAGGPALKRHLNSFPWARTKSASSAAALSMAAKLGPWSTTSPTPARSSGESTYLGTSRRRKAALAFGHLFPSGFLPLKPRFPRAFLVSLSFPTWS
jgi:tetratricopeptide (TPR) repeat protein